jgi:transposase
MAIQKHYTPEFKEQAIKLVRDEQRSVATVARELGVSDSALYSWVRLASLPPKGTSLEGLEHENMRLKKELRVAQMERDILKKAAAFFAKESRCVIE